MQITIWFGELNVHAGANSEKSGFLSVTRDMVAVGVGTMLAFMNGLGTFFTTLISRITAMVP